MLNSMIIELCYRTKEPLKDEKGEFEWVEMPTIDGSKKVKRYKDPSII